MSTFRATVTATLLLSAANLIVGCAATLTPNDAAADARAPSTDFGDADESGDANADAPDAPDVTDASDVTDATDAPDAIEAPDASDATDATDVPPFVVPVSRHSYPQRDGRCTRWAAWPGDLSLINGVAAGGQLWLAYQSRTERYIAHLRDGEWTRIEAPGIPVPEDSSLTVGFRDGRVLADIFTFGPRLTLALEGDTWRQVASEVSPPLRSADGRRVEVRDREVWVVDASGERRVSPASADRGIPLLLGMVDAFWVVHRLSIERCNAAGCATMLGPVDSRLADATLLGGRLLVVEGLPGSVASRLWQIDDRAATVVPLPSTEACTANSSIGLAPLADRVLVVTYCNVGPRYYARRADGWDLLPAPPASPTGARITTSTEGDVYLGASWRLRPRAGAWEALPRIDPPGVGVVGRSGAELYAVSPTAVNRLGADDRWRPIDGAPAGAQRLWLSPEAELYALVGGAFPGRGIHRWDGRAWSHELVGPEHFQAVQAQVGGRAGGDVWVRSGSTLLHREAGRWREVIDRPCAAGFDLIVTARRVVLHCAGDAAVVHALRDGVWAAAPLPPDEAGAMRLPVGVTATDSYDVIIRGEAGAEVRSIEDDRRESVSTSRIPWTVLGAWSPFGLVAAPADSRFGVLGSDRTWSFVSTSLLPLTYPGSTAQVWTDGVTAVFAESVEPVFMVTVRGHVVRCELR